MRGREDLSTPYNTGPSHNSGPRTAHTADSSSNDHDLGRRLAALISQQGERAFESGVASRRMLAQLQDLLGADTTLSAPMRDLMVRPGFQKLFGSDSDIQRQGYKDALLHELSQIYSARVTDRLANVLHGCLNLAPPARASVRTDNAGTDADAAWVGAGWTGPGAGQGQAGRDPSAYGAGTAAGPSASSGRYDSATANGYSANACHGDQGSRPPANPSPQVVTINPGNNALTGALITVLSLIAGALLMGLVSLLIFNRQQTAITTQLPSAQSESSSRSAEPAPEPAPTEEPALATPAEPEPQALDPAVTWQACQQNQPDSDRAPRQGETWWPVVGPGDALEAARQHCRSDAFTNSNGNVQVASFPDRQAAEAFADALTRDNSHPHSFWVGEATQR